MGGSVPAIPGAKVEGEFLYNLRREVASLVGRSQVSFPGAQPVSFARRHLEELTKEDYYVCEKSDGIRVLMYCTEDNGQEVIYLIDRKNDYYHVPNLHFPLPNVENLSHTRTLVDGELVNDNINGNIQMKYLVFDCLMLDGDSLMRRTLDKRLAYFRTRVYEPYESLYQKYPEEIQFLPFLVEFKNMEFSYGVEMMFKDILPSLPHGNDGLIFTGRNRAYKFGTDEHILKWKVESENSIDFRLSLEIPKVDPDSEDEEDGIHSPYADYHAMPIFHLDCHVDRDTYLRWGTMHVEPEEWEALKARQEPLDDRIVECFQDKQHRWRLLRFRDDKHEANHISTVESVIESIEDQISHMDLIRNSKRVRDCWKAREAAEKKAEFKPAKGAAAAPMNGGIKRKAEDGYAEEERSVKMRGTPEKTLSSP